MQYLDYIMASISKSPSSKFLDESQYPILCETCLGENPYMRMMVDRNGQECKVCSKPFTTYRWCPGPKMRFKRTEICQACAKVKNICQTCLLDINYGLPVAARDQLLKVDNALTIGPSSSSKILTNFARRKPYYKRNLPHICSFWIKGECKRGDECPYRHEKPTDPDDPLSQQNIKNRYHGVRDPVSQKIISKINSEMKNEETKVEPTEFVE